LVAVVFPTDDFITAGNAASTVIDLNFDIAASTFIALNFNIAASIIIALNFDIAASTFNDPNLDITVSTVIALHFLVIEYCLVAKSAPNFLPCLLLSVRAHKCCWDEDLIECV
jgi:hypothetical protein